MHLQGQTPSLSSKIRCFSRRHRLALDAPGAITVHRIVVLGDGTPDDYAVFLVSHRLNGTDVCAIIKPEGKTGTSTFELVRSYLSAYPSLRGLLFVLDQEESTPDIASSELERQVKKSKLEFTCRNDEHQGRLKVYDCALGERLFSLVLVLNGLSEIPTLKHTIEDHFLTAASRLGVAKLPEEIADPKSYWQNKVNIETQEIVFKKLSENGKLVEEVFPQQVKAFEYLKATGK